jgi:L-threonylcarbamoyladenylate synthase
MDAYSILKNGGVVVMPTDTIYGIVGTALNPKTVERIYFLRKRSLIKPFIILIRSMDDLKGFGIHLTVDQKKFLHNHWPNPLSVILSCKEDKYHYLHRGTNSLAFRIPKDKKIIELLRQAGPLVVPSANFEGEKPSETISEAKMYFGNRVDYYEDGGRINYKPSTLIKLDNKGTPKILRKGVLKL